LADDDDSIARAIQTALRFDGCDVIRAHDGTEAVRIGLEQDVDLILLDVQMPGLDGFGACRALRADPRRAAIPIVMLTAQSDPDLIATARGAGANDCMAKPFTVAELRVRVRTWLTGVAARGAGAA
jgi:DNA-binding response OmpR family regulator